MGVSSDRLPVGPVVSKSRSSCSQDLLWCQSKVSTGPVVICSERSLLRPCRGSLRFQLAGVSRGLLRGGTERGASEKPGGRASSFRVGRAAAARNLSRYDGQRIMRAEGFFAVWFKN